RGRAGTRCGRGAPARDGAGRARRGSASRTGRARRLPAARAPPGSPPRSPSRRSGGLGLLRLDDDLDGGPDVAAELDRHRIGAYVLDGLGELDAPPVDLEALGDEQALDVEIGHRAEEPPLLAHPGLHAQLETFEPLGVTLGILAVALRLGGDDALLVLEDAHVLAVCLDDETAWKKVVAGGARVDAYDVADVSAVGEVLAQDDLDGHGWSPGGLRGRPWCRAAARPCAPA